MTPVIGRLKKRPEFLKVAAARSKWVTPGLILQARRRLPPGEEASSLLAGGIAADDAAAEDAAAGGTAAREVAVRIGFTVSRKVGNAVCRNRARRRLRAAASQVLPELGRPGFDYVLIGRSGTLDRSYAALIEDLRTALKRVPNGDKSAPGRDGRRGRSERSR